MYRLLHVCKCAYRSRNVQYIKVGQTGITQRLFVILVTSVCFWLRVMLLWRQRPKHNVLYQHCTAAPNLYWHVSSAGCPACSRASNVMASSEMNIIGTLLSQSVCSVLHENGASFSLTHWYNTHPPFLTCWPPFIDDLIDQIASYKKKNAMCFISTFITANISQIQTILSTLTVWSDTFIEAFLELWCEKVFLTIQMPLVR